MEAAAAALEGSAFALWAARDPFAYPVASVVHVLGLVLLLGPLLVVDLRLLGRFRALPLGPLVVALTPLAVAGLLLQIASGAVLFAADATALAGSGVLRAKLILILLAVANAAAFRRLWQPAGATEAAAPARLLACFSLLLWTGAAVLGRTIAYA